MVRKIPALADVHEPYGRIASRLAELVEREKELTQEEARISRELKSWGARVGEIKADVVADLIAGKPYSVASATQSDQMGVHVRLADVREEFRLGREAQHRLHNELATAHAEASAKICATFVDEHQDLVRQLFALLLSVADVRVAIGQLRLDIERSGASALLTDTCADLFGGSLDRTSDMAYELRGAARAGYIDANSIPEELR